MSRRLLLVVLALVLSPSTHAGASDAAGVGPAPDYARAADWVCRPGSESVCTTGLDATVVSADGTRKAAPFVPAANPPIDCFYVYPTVSLEESSYSDLQDSPEIQRVVKAQTGRLTSRCRVFAPIYRQATIDHLRHVLQGMRVDDSDAPGRDVAAAFAYYMAHDNHGRGFVLVGHSQGTILLQQLIADDIDGKPAQALLVSAFLAGDPSLGIPAGKTVGGTFAHVPVCSAAAETGCVYAWGSYLAGDDAPTRTFGRPRLDGLVSACVNPAAPSGGSGALEFYHMERRRGGPWIESIGQLTGSCESDVGGDGFFVTIEPGRFSNETQALLERSQGEPGWGIHPYDIALVLGNMLDVIGDETATWTSRHLR